MRRVIPDIISNKQSVLVKGKLLSNNFLLATKSFMGFNRKKYTRNACLKVDKDSQFVIAKAFDTMEYGLSKKWVVMLGGSGSDAFFKTKMF